MTEPQKPSDDVVQALAKHWRESTVLKAEVLENLYEVNRIYLNVLALERPRTAASGEKPTAGAQLVSLDETTRAALARCPFSLFNARFHDRHFWGSQLKLAAVHEPLQRFLNFHPGHSDAAAFADLALFYAWHLVQSNPLAARILLGMTEQTVTAFRKLPLARIQQLAAEQPELLRPRWPARSPFWRGLLYVVQAGAAERLADMRLLGIQMIASELARSGPTI